MSIEFKNQDAMPTGKNEVYVELSDGTVGSFAEGGTIGRRGTMGAEMFSGIRAISRQHLSCIKREATWFITLLPEARNKTVFDAEPMRPGIAHRIVGRHCIQIGGEHFWVESAASYMSRNEDLYFAGTIAGGLPTGEPLETADKPMPLPGADTADDGPANGLLSNPPPMAGSTLQTAGSGNDGSTQELGSTANRLMIGLQQMGAFRGLRLVVDSSLMVLWASDEAREFFEIAAQQFPSTRFVDSIHSDDIDGVRVQLDDVRLSSRIETLKLRARRGRSFVSLEAEVSPNRDLLLLSLREESSLSMAASPDDGAGDADAALAAVTMQIKTLAFFSLSNAFQTGDLALSLSLLTVNSQQCLDCARVRVWMFEADSDRVVTCKALHDGSSSNDGIEQRLNLNYCQDYFDKISNTPYIASAREDDPTLDILKQIGYVRPDCRSVLTTGMKIGGEYCGLISFERIDGDLKWTQPERHYALCAASYALLALQAYRQKLAMAKLKKTGELLAGELKEAQNYIYRVLPENLDTPDVSTEWQFVPSEELGGDSFGFHWIDDDNLAIYIIDVVGHGTGAALLSVSAMNTLRSNLLPQEDFVRPEKVVGIINRAFQMEDQNMLTFSMWFGVYNKTGRTIRYCSAGHPPALLLMENSADGLPQYYELETGGLMVGGIDDAEYESKEISIGSGEAKLYVFTDGAFEVPMSNDRMWTFEEFTAAVRSTHDMESGETDYLLQRVQVMCKTSQLPDDFCMVRFLFHSR